MLQLLKCAHIPRQCLIVLQVWGGGGAEQQGHSTNIGPFTRTRIDRHETSAGSG